MPQLHSKGMRLSSSRDVWTRYSLGETRACSRDQLRSPPQTSSCPSSQDFGANWSQHSTQQKSSTTESRHLLRLQRSQPQGKTPLHAWTQRWQKSKPSPARAWPALCSRSSTPWPKLRQPMNYASASAEISPFTAPTKPTNFLTINPAPPIPHELQPASACGDAAAAAKTSALASPPAKSNLPAGSSNQ